MGWAEEMGYDAFDEDDLYRALRRLELEACPYCGAKTIRTSHEKVYGRKIPGAGRVIICTKYPACDSYVGCHRNGEAKGSLANAELRNARRRAHEAFDMIWRRGLMSRGDAYAWLARKLGLQQRDCHMAHMRELKMLAKVVTICEQRLGAPARVLSAKADFTLAP